MDIFEELRQVTASVTQAKEREMEDFLTRNPTPCPTEEECRDIFLTNVRTFLKEVALQAYPLRQLRLHWDGVRLCCGDFYQTESCEKPITDWIDTMKTPKDIMLARQISGTRQVRTVCRKALKEYLKLEEEITFNGYFTIKW